VEASVNNDTYLYEISSDMELGFDDDDSSSVASSGASRFYGRQYTFLRFTDVAVPAGAQVQTAKVVFSVKKHGSCCNEDFDVTVKMQNSPNALAFESPLGGIWNGSTTSGLTYTPPMDIASSEGDYVEGSTPVTRNSPDLASMVQELVDLNGWSSGNAMAVMFGDATSTNTAQSREYWSFSRRRSSGPPESWAPKLEITYCPPITCSDGSAPQTATSQIARYEDDVEASVNNDTYLYEISSDMELGFDDDDSSSVASSGASRFYGRQYTFLRFTDVAVPAGAQVQTAKVVFSVKKHGSCCNEDFDVTVKMQNSPNALAFESPLGGIWNGSTTSGLTYTPPMDIASSEGDYVEGSTPVTRNSPDLASMVQELVDLNGWSSGNAMAVMFGDATSTNTAQSREYWSFSRRRSSGPPESWAPKLEITYCPGSEGDDETQTGGDNSSSDGQTTTSSATVCGFGLLTSVSLLHAWSSYQQQLEILN